MKYREGNWWGEEFIQEIGVSINRDLYISNKYYISMKLKHLQFSAATIRTLNNWISWLKIHGQYYGG